jgi:hypothetical protein
LGEGQVKTVRPAAYGRNPDLVPDPNRLGGHLLVGHHCEA